MRLNDKADYTRESREDLLTRLMLAQQLGHFLLHAFDMLVAYGVNFKSLPEWQDTTVLDEARKLKPHAAQEKVAYYIERLHTGLRAAVRRKQMGVVK